MSTDQVIVTPRLALRHVAASDAPRIVALINDLRISRNLARVPYPYSMKDAEEFLAWVADFEDPGTLRVICRKGELIGVVSYDRDDRTKPFELGYWLGVDYWGQGFMSEAVQALVAHAFQVTGVDQLTSCYFDFNPVSGKVLRRAGFEETGPCSTTCKATGETVATMQMRLTRERWEKLEQG